MHRDEAFRGLLLVGRRDGVREVEKDIVRVAVERLLEQRRLRAGNRELAPLESWMRRLVAGEAHARTAARGGDAAGDGFAPGACGAAGDCPAAARGAGGGAGAREGPAAGAPPAPGGTGWPTSATATPAPRIA